MQSVFICRSAEKPSPRTVGLGQGRQPVRAGTSIVGERKTITYALSHHVTAIQRDVLGLYSATLFEVRTASTVVVAFIELSRRAACDKQVLFPFDSHSSGAFYCL